MTFLARALESTRRDVTALAVQAVEPRDPGRLPQALRGRDRLSVIAEIKRRSPSRGELSADVSPGELARRYVDGGASAISVITCREGFGGSLDDLREVRGAVELPILMKDFVIDERQVRAAAHAGADGVLLMVRCLPGGALASLLAACEEVGLAALVECHDAREVARAVELGASLVGVNNRDLATLDVDRARARMLLPSVPEGTVAIAESGYERAEHLDELRGRCDAVLVGSALMTSVAPARKLRELLSCA